MLNPEHTKEKIIERAKALLKNNAEINATNETGQTILHLLVEKEVDELIPDLISHGANIDAKVFRWGNPIDVCIVFKKS